MLLRDGVLAVRQTLGELKPWLYSDDEIVQKLNISARILTSAAQSITNFVTFNSLQLDDGVWAQEYALPSDVDQITGAQFKSGTIYNLEPWNAGAPPAGSNVSGLPTYFWTRRGRILTERTAVGGEQGVPFAPNDDNNSRLIFGVWPMPNQLLPFYIWYIAFHPQMLDPLAVVQIPDIFEEAWTSYAIAKLKEKESAIDEAQYYRGLHETGKREFVEYMMTNGQEIGPPQYRHGKGQLSAASTIIVVAQNPGMSNI